MKKVQTFKERFNEALKSANITQYRIAKITGIPQTTMSDYCCGIYEPKRENLTLIAKILNVQETWLLGYDVPKEIDKSYKDDIMSKLSLLNSFELEKIDKMVDIFLSFTQN